MDIGQAIQKMKADCRVARLGWNGKEMYIKIQNPDRNSMMTESYVWMYTAQKGRIPWLCSQADLLANDWIVV